MPVFLELVEDGRDVSKVVYPSSLLSLLSKRHSTLPTDALNHEVSTWYGAAGPDVLTMTTFSSDLGVVDAMFTNVVVLGVW